MTHNLGASLTETQYVEFREALADTLPGLRAQIINTGGKFVVNGNLSSDELKAIQALYDTHCTAQVATGFSMLAHQSLARRRKQTSHASFKRQAMAMRFSK